MLLSGRRFATPDLQLVRPLPNLAMVSDRFDEILSNQKDLLAAHYLAPLSTSYLPWSGYAMRPSGLVQVLDLLQK